MTEPNNCILRLESEKDRDRSEFVTREAFWNVYRPGCSEHYILHRFRDLSDFVPDLNYVLETDGEVIGHIMYSHAEIQTDDGQKIPIMVFGPVSILPEYQGRGYGSMLITHTLKKAADLGCGAVAITGNPDYYKRFGFESGQAYGVYYAAVPRSEETPFFMIKELKKGYLDGIVGSYTDPPGYFADDAAVEAFDRRFEPKEKKKLPGQLV